MSGDYIEKDDDDFGDQLSVHAQGMAAHGATVGFTPGEIDEADKDAKLWAYTLGRVDYHHAYGLELGSFKKLLRKGHEGQALPAAFPVAAANPVPVPDLTLANIEARFRARAKRAKAHPAYTTGIGQALRIEKTAGTFDPADGKPLLKVALNFAGHPHIKFKKGGWQGLELQKLVIKQEQEGPVPPVQPNDPRFVKLERIFGHDYVDPTELPSGGKAEIWIYKGIYLYQNQLVATPSDLVMITVGGI